MQNSLGIYIEDNIIKYAKLEKEKDIIKVEAYNIAFYDNDLEEQLNKIISETYSYKVPISINLSNEIYNSFEVSSLLSKQDTKKAIKIEYEMLCNEKGYNKALIDHKYVLVDKKEDPEKQKVLNVIANKNEISKKVAMLSGKRISTITPIATSIANLVAIDGRENFLIVNIEGKTKITTVIDGQLYQIDELEEGMKTILDEINVTENSYSKSYEVCKNMTLYTQNSPELYADSNEYMDIVTTTLYKIIDETKRIASGFFSNIDKIYITGLGTCINNVDLYFQENIPTAKCEILKPFFVDTASMQMPIKEYIEVNSAIALALDGLGMINKNLNFSKNSKVTVGSNTKVSSVLNSEINLSTIKSYFSSLGYNIKTDFAKPLQSSEKVLIRGIVACFMTALLFVAFSNTIVLQIDNKMAEVTNATESANEELAKIDEDITLISEKTSAYKKFVQELTNTGEDETVEEGRTIDKDSIPNLLNRIMFVIPKKVKLTSIKNTTSDHIVIIAEAEKYEQLGYFKAVLSTNEILKNVKSTSGAKNGNVVQVTIEGDLP